MSIAELENTLSADATRDLRQAREGRSSISSHLYRRGFKRAFDILLALMILPFVAPLLLILSFIVRRDGGDGFYSQTRIGVAGREFQCWKLRTMVVDAEAMLKKICEQNAEVAKEWETNQKLKDDSRITDVGRFLRATSLDELPQIWNILRGDMSFVGPRPFMASQDQKYRDAGGALYYSVRPGITGPWQVFGRGETTFADRVRYDNLYCRKVTFPRDMMYIGKTVGVVLRRTGC